MSSVIYNIFTIITCVIYMNLLQQYYGYISDIYDKKKLLNYFVEQVDLLKEQKMQDLSIFGV